MPARAKAGLSFLIFALSLVPFRTGPAAERQNKRSRLEGEYRIFASGQEIGIEKFVVSVSQDGITSSSATTFQNPGEGHQKVLLESRMEMNDQYVPRQYELKSEVDGQKGTIRGNFAPNQVIFEYSGNGVSTRNGQLVGDRYTILDTNLFHHFIFLARLYQYDSKLPWQMFQVVIPQDKEVGALKISQVGRETITIKKDKLNTTHLNVDSGLLQIQMWVDDDRVPRKIALPDKGIEVVYNR